MNRPRLFLLGFGAMAMLALSSDPLLTQEWSPVGPATGPGGARGSLVIESALPSAPGVVWLAGRQAIATSLDRGDSWRFTAPAAPFDRAFALAADRLRPRHLYVATDQDFFRSVDGGASWFWLSRDGSYRNALEGEAPAEIVTAQQGQGLWLFVTTSKRLLASSDGGWSWRLSYSVGENTSLRAFVAQPRGGAAPVLYLSRLGPIVPELLRSTDGGASWVSLPSLLLPPAGVDRLVASAAAVFGVLRYDGIYRSTDRGESWRPVLGGRPNDRFDASAIALDPRAPGFVYAHGFHEPFDGVRLWRSHDGGVTWKPLGSAGSAVSELVIEPATATLYARSGQTLTRSRDRGASWSTVFTAPDTESSWAQLTFRRGDPIQQIVTVGYSVYRSEDAGMSWRFVSAPRFFTAVDIDPRDAQRLIGIGSSFAYLSTDGGANWQFRASSLSYAESLLRLGGNKLLVSGCGVARTTDNGLTWRETLPCFPTPTSLGRWTQKLEVDPTHPKVVYALGFSAEIELPHGLLTDFPSFLWRSDDSGGSWKKVTRNLRAFAVDARGRLFGVRGRTLLASDDFGQTWHTITTTPWPFDDLATDPSPSDRLFALRGNGEFFCRGDGDTSWTALPRRGPPGDEVGRLFLHPVEPNALYAASRWGVSRLSLPAGVCE